jgi:hypothetical protein
MKWIARAILLQIKLFAAYTRAEESSHKPHELKNCLGKNLQFQINLFSVSLNLQLQHTPRLYKVHLLKLLYLHIHAIEVNSFFPSLTYPPPRDIDQTNRNTYMGKAIFLPLLLPPSLSLSSSLLFLQTSMQESFFDKSFPLRNL